jgi:interferon-induced GTP-binding protein Mx1
MAMSLEGNAEYRSFMDKLAQSSVDDYIDLPMIAVMGDTSSGKSSLLSMISTVELPSSETLTTRCPIMLQMRNADKREATVKVQWKDAPPGVEVHFEPKTVDESNWKELTAFIADAQEHVIAKSGKEIARDIVSVNLQGPLCEDLTLIDLPGIVRSTGKGESASLSEDIQSLLDDYLKNPRGIVLAVHPSNVDFHNSQIMAEARKVDPDTKRTIPVLTKPDLIDAGAETSVKELLLGLKTDTFEKGFHMVKGRGQESLNKHVGIDHALNEEETFFRNTQPWRDVFDATLFGTKNLRSKLGDLQMRLIRESFPFIVSEMKEKKAAASASLAELGEMPSSLFEKRCMFHAA